MKKDEKRKVKKATKNTIDQPIGHEHVYAYLNKSLSEQQTKRFAIHLSKCSPCLDLVIQWHYERVLDEMNARYSDKQSADKDWKDKWGGSHTMQNPLDYTVSYIG